MHKEEYGSIGPSISPSASPNYDDNEYVSINGKKVFKSIIYDDEKDQKVFKNIIYDDEKDQVEIVYYSKTDKNKFLLELKCQGLSFLIIPLNL